MFQFLFITFVKNYKMPETKIILSIKEQIDRNLDGRKQKWIVEKLNDLGNEFTDVTFSRKKNGDLEFSEKELQDLSKILGVELI